MRHRRAVLEAQARGMGGAGARYGRRRSAGLRRTGRRRAAQREGALTALLH